MVLGVPNSGLGAGAPPFTDGDRESPGEVRAGSSGRLIPGYEARLVDDEDRDVVQGEIGALLIRGDSTCAGY